MREVVHPPDFEGWRAAARRLLAEEVPPAQTSWREGSGSGIGVSSAGPASGALRVPREFVQLAQAVARHPDPSRWALLYSILWRLLHGERDLLRRSDDPEAQQLFRMRDAAPAAAPAGDSAPLFGDIALRRGTEEKPDAPSARPFVPETRDLAALRKAAMSCRGCELYKDATQTVFGEGPPDARLVFVGEQPGDQEDRRGAPFVGPAGEVFDRALAQAGLERRSVYVTNAVKHFKFVIQRGGRRIHQTPRSIEIGACRPWLEAELAAIRPELLVCLGASASKALLGPDFRLMKERGRFMARTGWAPKVMATLHPSAVLRGETPAAQEALYGLLLGDLRMVAGSIAGTASG
jgi:DNA polymerase